MQPDWANVDRYPQLRFNETLIAAHLKRKWWTRKFRALPRASGLVYHPEQVVRAFALRLHCLGHVAGKMPSTNQGYHTTAPPPDPMQVSFKLDEGYSEETRSQAESDTGLRSLSQSREMTLDTGLPDWIINMNEADKTGRLKVHE